MGNAVRTGSVFLRNFDRGVVESLGGVVMQRSVEGRAPQSNYFLPLDRFTKSMRFPGTGPGNAAQITFAGPEETYEITEIPAVLVRRGDFVFAPQRWHPHTKEYRIPAKGAKELFDAKGNSIGYSKYESKEWALPHDIPYDISVLARVRDDATAMLRHVLRIFKPPASSLAILDELNTKRTYDAFNEGTTAADELASVAERVVGFTISIRVEGELDLNDPVYDVAVAQPTVSVGLK